MLFANQTTLLMKKIFDDALNQASNIRKADTEKRLSLYHDEQVDYVISNLEKYYPKTDSFFPVFLNITKKIIDLRSVVYLEKTKRYLKEPATEQDKAIFAEISDSVGFDLKWKLINRYCKLLKTLLIRPVWRQGHMDLDILTGDILDVQTGDTPEDLQKVMITHYPESGKYDEVEYSLWTAESFHRIDYNGNVIETADNPYRVLPFIPIFDRVPTSSFWLPGGEDIIAAQEGINHLLTELMRVISMQGFGVAVGKGIGNEDEIEFGPQSVVHIESETGDFRFEKTNAPIAQVLQAIEFITNHCCVNNGLSARNIQRKTTQQSAVAKFADSAELSEMRRDDIQSYERYESQLWNLIKIVWNVHNPGRKISPDAQLKVDFADPKTPVTDVSKQSLFWKEQLEMGVLSPVDVVMEKNPDLSREEAIKYLEQVQEENKKFRPSLDVKQEQSNE